MRRTHLVLAALAATGCLAATSACTPAAPSPGDAALNLDFSSSRSGTVTDGGGRGTGFTDVQANKNGAGASLDRSKVTLDPGAGRLRIVSTAGSNSGSTNTQLNALQLAFNGSSQRFAAEARIVGIGDLTTKFQQEAIYFGPNQDNYVKVQVEFSTNNVPSVVTAREQGGTFNFVNPVAIPTPGTVTAVDLRITATPSSGAIQASYRLVRGASVGSWTNIGTAFTPSNKGAWFNSDARAGVFTSNTGTSTTVTGSYDHFRIVAA